MESTCENLSFVEYLERCNKLSLAVTIYQSYFNYLKYYSYDVDPDDQVEYETMAEVSRYHVSAMYNDYKRLNGAMPWKEAEESIRKLCEIEDNEMRAAIQRIAAM